MIIDSELENRMNGMCPVARAAAATEVSNDY